MTEEVENAIGWRFRDAALLQTALTSPAYRMDHPSARDNQRLEFLGDAVFGLLSAEALYRAYENEDEGCLTVRRAHFASGAALAAAATKIGLVHHLRVNAHAPEPDPGSKTAADAMEAVLGAVWLDGGLDAARAVFARLWPDVREDGDLWAGNPKGRLQVEMQSRHPPLCPRYTTISRSGPSHAPVWKVAVEVPGLESAEGEGATKRAAESAAAAAMLAALGVK